MEVGSVIGYTLPHGIPGYYSLISFVLDGTILAEQPGRFNASKLRKYAGYCER